MSDTKSSVLNIPSDILDIIYKYTDRPTKWSFVRVCHKFRSSGIPEGYEKLPIAKWYHSLMDETVQLGHFELVRYINYLMPILTEKHLKIAIEHGHIKLAKWLYPACRPIEYGYDIIHMVINYNNLELFEFIWHYVDFDVDGVIRHIIRRRNIDIAKFVILQNNELREYFVQECYNQRIYDFRIRLANEANVEVLTNEYDLMTQAQAPTHMFEWISGFGKKPGYAMIREIINNTPIMAWYLQKYGGTQELQDVLNSYPPSNALQELADNEDQKDNRTVSVNIKSMIYGSTEPELDEDEDDAEAVYWRDHAPKC